MKKIPLLLIFYCLLFSINDFAQNQHKIDSLQYELKKFETHKKKLGSNVPSMFDSTKADLLFEISKNYRGSNPDTAIFYTQQAFSLSEKIGYKKGIGNAYNGFGGISYEKGDYTIALEYYQKSLKICTEIGYKKGIGNARNGIGSIYYSECNLPEALENHSTALKIRKEIGDKQGIAYSLCNIGVIYSGQGNDFQALNNLLTALKMMEELGDKRGIELCYLKIGDIYYVQTNFPEALKNYRASLKISEEIGNKHGIADSYYSIGNIYYGQGNFQQAEKNILIGLKKYQEIGLKDGISNAYYCLGTIYLAQGNYSESLKDCFIALKMCEQLLNKDGIANLYILMGNVYEKQGKLKESLKYELKGLSLALEVGDKDHLKRAYANLARINAKLKNYKSAYDYEVLFKQYYDSIYNTENENKLTSLQMHYEYDKKESLAKAEQEKKDAIALKEMQKQKLVRNGFVGGFAVVLIFAGVFFRQRNKIKKGKKLSDELLLNILPSEVAEELKHKGRAEAKQFDDVTVMFTDFKDFTKISERLSPAELVAEIDACFIAFDNILDKYNIEKIKTIGDSYMCAGGLPVPNKTHASDVVKAALEIQKFMGEHSQQKIKEGKKVFELRIGIHSGSVVAGIVGIKKFAYDIWGNTVNIASRMESSGEAGKVNISGSTYELVKNEFNCIHRGKIEAKHMGMIDMYFVTDSHVSVS